MAQTIVDQNQTGTESNIYLLPGNTITVPIIKPTTTWHFLTPFVGYSYPTVYHFETDDFTFLEGRVVTIDSLSVNGSKTNVHCPIPHGFVSSDRVFVDTVDSTYDGEYSILYIDNNTFRIDKPFGTTSTGYVYIGARFKSLHPEYYQYNISYCVSFRTTVSNVLDHTSFEFMLKSTGDIVDTQRQVSTPDSSVWHQAYPTTTPYTLDLPQDEELIFAYSVSTSLNPLLFRSLVIKIDRVI